MAVRLVTRDLPDEVQHLKERYGFKTLLDGVIRVAGELVESQLGTPQAAAMPQARAVPVINDQGRLYGVRLNAVPLVTGPIFLISDLG